MRKFQEVAGIVMTIVGIGFSAYSFATQFGYMPPIISDWRVTLAVGVGLFFIGVLLYLAKHEGFQQQLKPEVNDEEGIKTPKQEPAQTFSKPKTKRIRKPQIYKKFSYHLEEIKKERTRKGWEISGIGLGFLDKIKTAPPFLGLPHCNPIVSESDERELIEFFKASIYMEKYRDDIRGGKNHIVRDGENDRKSVAKAVYGHERYEVYVPALHSYPNGMVLTLPYLNLNRPDYPDEVKRIVTISRDMESIISLLERYNLTRREAIPLLRMVYDAAQNTLYGKNSSSIT